MCLLCFDITGKWLSPACYRRHESETRSNGMVRCIECRVAWARSTCGTYCLRCAARRAQTLRERTLLEEATAQQNLDWTTTGLPSAAPAAMNLLPWQKPAGNMSDYKDTADWLPHEHCRLCLQVLDATSWPQSLEDHLHHSHACDLQEYRHVILQDAHCGLRPMPVQLLRSRLAAYRNKSHATELGVCAACARAKPQSKLVPASFGCPAQVPAWLGWSQDTWEQHGQRWASRVNGLLDTESYWVHYFHGPERLEAAKTEYANATAAGCALTIARTKRPPPAEIRNLNWLGRRVLQLGRAVVCIRHLPRACRSAEDPEATPLYTTGNVHVFPQKGSEVSRALGLLPLDLCCDIGVQYPGSHIPTPFHDPDLRICLQDLRAALWWYCENNWEWMVATRDDDCQHRDHLGARLEHLLQEYHRDGVSHLGSSVPSSLRSSASTTSFAKAAATDASSTSDTSQQDAEASAAFLDTGFDDATPLGLWTAAMRKYDVLVQCENSLLRDESTSNSDRQSARARALWEAVQALQRLSNEDVLRQLQDYEQNRQTHPLVLDLGRTDTLLDSQDPSFWAHCFCDLFYRADCRERPGQNPCKLSGKQWARALMKRVDFQGWVQSKEFAAVAANVFMRREQMASIHSWLRVERGFTRIQATLSTLSVQEFVAAAASQAGDFNSLAHALQCKLARSARLHQLFRA
eukprot:s3817_g3.t1